MSFDYASPQGQAFPLEESVGDRFPRSPDALIGNATLIDMSIPIKAFLRVSSCIMNNAEAPFSIEKIYVVSVTSRWSIVEAIRYILY